MNNYCVRKADYFKNFRRKYHNSSLFISEATSFFIIHFFKPDSFFTSNTNFAFSFPRKLSVS